MNKLLKISMFLFVFLLISGCSRAKGNSSGSWAYEKMISLNGVSYVVTSEKIEKVDAKIGEIKHYSTNESDFNQENFSNYFKIGTKLYSIPNTTIKDAIAVEIEKDQFYKAVNILSLNK